MTTFESLMVAVSFASLVVAILSFNAKKESTIELSALVDYPLRLLTPTKGSITIDRPI